MYEEKNLREVDLHARSTVETTEPNRPRSLSPWLSTAAPLRPVAVKQGGRSDPVSEDHFPGEDARGHLPPDAVGPRTRSDAAKPEQSELIESPQLPLSAAGEEEASEEGRCKVGDSDPKEPPTRLTRLPTGP